MSAKERNATVSFDKPFIAANAECGFVKPDKDDGNDYYISPDYLLTDGGKWVVRMGLIDVCWGTRVSCKDGEAMLNGSLYVKRLSADENSLCRKGILPVTVGSVKYYYECEWCEGRLVGIVPTVRPALVNEIVALAEKCRVDELRELLCGIRFAEVEGEADAAAYTANVRAADCRLSGLCSAIEKICQENFLIPDSFMLRGAERVADGK